MSMGSYMQKSGERMPELEEIWAQQVMPYAEGRWPNTEGGGSKPYAVEMHDYLAFHAAHSYPLIDYR